MSSDPLNITRQPGSKTPSLTNEHVEGYMLPTRFNGDCVEHKVPFSSRSRGVRRGVRVRKWRTGKELGRGGFGVVNLQTEERSGKLRAVKRVLRTSAATIDPLRELTAMAALSKDQANFVQLLGWYQNETHLFIAMEYFEFGDLGSYVKAPLAEPDVQGITFQITEALCFMHTQNFAHRDLKPSNIFVVQAPPHGDWWVKVADFGISKCHHENTELNTMLSGHSTFAAPELMGLSDDFFVTNAVDLWSVGSITAWLITSDLILQPTNMFAFCNGRFPLPLHKLTDKGLSESGVNFVSCLLKYDPANRLTAEAALAHVWLDDFAKTLDAEDTVSVFSDVSSSTVHSSIMQSASQTDTRSGLSSSNPLEQSIEARKVYPRPGRTRISKKLVHARAICELGYDYSSEDEKIYKINMALGPDNLQELYRRSEALWDQERHQQQEPSEVTPDPENPTKILRNTSNNLDFEPREDVARHQKAQDAFAHHAYGNDNGSDIDKNTQRSNRRPYHYTGTTLFDSSTTVVPESIEPKYQPPSPLQTSPPAESTTSIQNENPILRTHWAPSPPTDLEREQRRDRKQQQKPKTRGQQREMNARTVYVDDNEEDSSDESWEAHHQTSKEYIAQAQQEEDSSYEGWEAHHRASQDYIAQSQKARPSPSRKHSDTDTYWTWTANDKMDHRRSGSDSDRQHSDQQRPTRSHKSHRRSIPEGPEPRHRPPLQSQSSAPANIKASLRAMEREPTTRPKQNSYTKEMAENLPSVPPLQRAGRDPNPPARSRFSWRYDRDPSLNSSMPPLQRAGSDPTLPKSRPKRGDTPSKTSNLKQTEDSGYGGDLPPETADTRSDSPPEVPISFKMASELKEKAEQAKQRVKERFERHRNNHDSDVGRFLSPENSYMYGNGPERREGRSSRPQEPDPRSQGSRSDTEDIYKRSSRSPLPIRIAVNESGGDVQIPSNSAKATTNKKEGTALDRFGMWMIGG